MKVDDSKYGVMFRYNLNEIIYKCECLFKNLEKVKNYRALLQELKTATETLKSPCTTKEEVYKTLRKLVQTWEIFGEDIYEMKKAYKEDKEVIVIITSRDGQIPVLCSLTQKDLFEPEKESEEEIEDVLKSLPNMIEEVTIKGVKYKKVLVAKWEKA